MILNDTSVMVAILSFQINSPMFINQEISTKEKLIDLWRRKYAGSLSKQEAMSLYHGVSQTWAQFGDSLINDNLKQIKKVIGH